MSKLVELPIEEYNPRAFDAFRAVADFDLGTARAMAWMSQLAYETRHPGKIADVCRMWGLGAPHIVASPDTDLLPLERTRAVIVEGRGATIVAFAGTDPLVPENWITDVDIGFTPDDLHRGFERAACSVWDAVKGLLEARVEQPVLLTGHSLGAALAAVTAEDILVKLKIRPAAVYCFGMPRVGNGVFARRYNDELGDVTFRLVHGDDIVAAVPRSSRGFRHVGLMLRCERAGRFANVVPGQPLGDDPPFRQVLADGMLQALRDFLALRLQPTFRRDLLGRLSGLLAPSIADHLPDRYCHALDM